MNATNCLALQLLNSDNSDELFGLLFSVLRFKCDQIEPSWEGEKTIRIDSKLSSMIPLRAVG